MLGLERLFPRDQRISRERPARRQAGLSANGRIRELRRNFFDSLLGENIFNGNSEAPAE